MAGSGTADPPKSSPIPGPFGERLSAVSLSAEIGVRAGSPSAPVVTLGERESRRVIVVISLAYALLACALSAQVALPEIRRTIPMTDIVTSLHGSFFGWALLVGGLFGSRLVGAFGRSRFLAMGVLGLGAGAVLFATGHVVAQTLAGAALSGASGAVIVITVPGLVADTFADRRSEVFTKLNTVPALAGLAFPLLVSGAPSVSLTWRWPTVVLPALLVTAIVATGHTLRNDSRSPRNPAHDTGARAVLSTLRIAPVRRRFLLQVLSVTIEFAFAVWVVTYLREVVGLSRDRAPLGAAAWALGMFGGRALVPRLIRSLGRFLEASGFTGVIAGTLLLMYGHWSGVRVVGVPMVSFSLAPMYTLGVERLFQRGEAAAADTAHIPANGSVTGTANSTANLSALAAVASGLAITCGPLLVGAAGDVFGLRQAMWTIPIGAALGLLLCVVRWGDEAGRLGQ